LAPSQKGWNNAAKTKAAATEEGKGGSAGKEAAEAPDTPLRCSTSWMRVKKLIRTGKKRGLVTMIRSIRCRKR